MLLIKLKFRETQVSEFHYACFINICSIPGIKAGTKPGRMARNL